MSESKIEIPDAEAMRQRILAGEECGFQTAVAENVPKFYKRLARLDRGDVLVVAKLFPFGRECAVASIGSSDLAIGTWSDFLEDVVPKLKARGFLVSSDGSGSYDIRLF